MKFQNIIKVEEYIDPVEYYDLSIEDTHNFCLANGAVVHNTGVGYSVQDVHINKLPIIAGPSTKTRRFLVGDSIEGWADAVKVLIKAYTTGKSDPVFDYRDIRPKGARLVTSGGKAPGPDPLKICVEHLRSILNGSIGRKLKSIEIHDMCCHIADAVLAGGIRRAAMIVGFDIGDMDMLSCKSGSWWELNPQRGRANNSVILKRGKVTEAQFKHIWNIVEQSNAGEPGFYWTDDLDVFCNPCVEISLLPNEFCNLSTVDVSNMETQEELNSCVRAAAILGTLQAGYTDFHYLRPVWKETTEKEALIGVSMTGIGSGKVLKLNLEEAANIVNKTNVEYAKKIGINPAARTTAIKPEGCLNANTKIKTSKGVMSLNQLFELNDIDPPTADIGFVEIKEEISVYDMNNDLQLVTKLFNNGIVDTIKIEFIDGSFVECTENHKFLTKAGWKRADMLTEDDDIVQY